MKRKVEKQSQATDLRIDGYSMSEIAAKLKVSRSSVSLWTRNVNLSTEAKIKLSEIVQKRQEKASNVLRNRKVERLALAESVASKEMDLKQPFSKFSMLSMLSLMYFCEGNKNDQFVGFTNSDLELTKLFITLLRKCFDLDESKFRACVHVHDYHNITKQQAVWSEAISIPLNQFTLPYCKPSTHVAKKSGYQGCVRVSYYDAHVSRVLLAFAKKLMTHYS